MSEPRYFIDHDTIHDRVTGKHVELQEAADLLSVEPEALNTVDSMIAELRELRALLATPCETEVRWHNNGRGPRVVFEVGSEDFIVDDKRAIALGAALIREALAARDALKASGKESE